MCIVTGKEVAVVTILTTLYRNQTQDAGWNQDDDQANEIRIRI
jgi:hypothetical protein